MRRKNSFVGILFLIGLGICVSIVQFLNANPGILFLIVLFFVVFVITILTMADAQNKALDITREIQFSTKSQIADWGKEEQMRTIPFPVLPNVHNQLFYQSVFFSSEKLKEASKRIHLTEYSNFIFSLGETAKNRIVNRIPNSYKYPVQAPSLPKFPDEIEFNDYKQFPEEPIRNKPDKWYYYLMIWNLITGLIEYRNLFEIYKRQVCEIEKYNTRLSELKQDRQLYFQERKKEFEEKAKCIKDQWHQSKEQWESEALKDIKKYKELCSIYESWEPDGVAQYFIAQIDAIPLFSCCDREYEIEFDPQEGILLLNLKIPYMRDVEIVKTRKLVSGEKEVPVTQKEAREIMNQLPFLILMRVIWEIPHVDYKDKITLIACNGYVVYDDPATGKTRQDIILSIVAKPDDLKQILLEKIDPEVCFRSLKGVAASKITDLVPVQPIIQFNKNDSRFVLAKEVIEGIDGDNLASMEWQDFEHLIRDLFEKEFGRSGAEVKITQASRDRGVDAIVFDPDPLRGGKFVIQAKRYSNTVDVSAVRDLYGTIMNEGANRGILVTTSNFGRDSYEFAKDKPISLMNGGNLLHLLEKHGYHAKIDLKEAKKLLKVTS